MIDRLCYWICRRRPNGYMPLWVLRRAFLFARRDELGVRD